MGGHKLSEMNAKHRVGFGLGLYDGPKVAAGGTLFAVGGSTSARSETGVGEVELYFVKANEWVTIQPLQQPRFDTAVCAYQGQMYVCGGYHKGTLSSVEQFNVITRRRGVAPNMLTSRASAAHASAADEGLFILGGFGSDGKALASVERFDHEKQLWVAVKPMIK